MTPLYRGTLCSIMQAALVILSILFFAALGTLLWLARQWRMASQQAISAEQDAVALRAKLEAQDQAHETYSTQLKAHLAERDEALRNAFKVSANEAIKSTSETVRTQTDQRLTSQLKPVADTLKELKEANTRIEGDRKTSEGTFKEMLRASQVATQQLRQETGTLVNALRKPEVRGRYGEVQLLRVIELAGMRKYCDFTTQSTSHDDEGRALRPDCVVHLPNNRHIVIDAKNNTAHYLAAIESPNEAETHLKAYAKGVLDQAKALAKKEYWNSHKDTLDLVVMFIPGDQFLDAAMQYEPELLDIAAQNKVLLASPASLIGLLRAVWVGWREQSITEQAEELLALGKQFHERAAKVLEYVDDVGKGLQRTTAAYNKLAGSIDARLMPTLKRFDDAGAASNKELASPRRVESIVNDLQSLPAPEDAQAGDVPRSKSGF